MGAARCDSNRPRLDLYDDDPTPFPTRLTLWWIGLGIEPLRIPRHTPQRNGRVERSHRTLNERTLIDQQFRDAAHLQAQVDADWSELNTVCPSRAGDCEGRPPVTAHRSDQCPRRLYCPEQEAALFDLRAVDAYLAQFTWVRTASAQGQLCARQPPLRVGASLGWTESRRSI